MNICNLDINEKEILGKKIREKFLRFLFINYENDKDIVSDLLEIKALTEYYEKL